MSCVKSLGHEPLGLRRRMNHELDALFEQPNFVRSIRWLGHVQWINGHRIRRKLFEGAAEVMQRKGRPCVQADLYTRNEQESLLDVCGFRLNAPKECYYLCANTKTYLANSPFIC